MGEKRPRGGSLAIAEENLLTITPLGSGQEVGRSCHVITYKNKTIMLDCGIHPGRQGLDQLPYFDAINPADIDLLIVSHFHLDHIAALPHFLEKTNFKGRVFMTHPTKAVYKWMLADFVKVSTISTEDMLFDEKDLDNSMDKIETMNFHQTVEIDEVKFTAYNAGHVLGAAMIELEIAGVRILYTGDYSCEEDRHLMAAEIPPNVPHILMVEATYGVQVHEPQAEREARFTSVIHDIVRRGGRVLIPVFALGRAQELLLILDEYWRDHPELHNIPIYYASSLAKRCMNIYQTYVHMMNDRIRRQHAVSNPFVFKHISNLKSMEHFDDSGPCVVMASPGMLQSGLSRELFEMWCPNPRNGCVIAGYSVEGTLAKHILSEPSEIVAMNGHKLPLRMSVHYISFSAHADFAQTSKFIDTLRPQHIVLVHGMANEMMRLQQALVRFYEDKPDVTMNIYTPKNTETLELEFKGDKMAKVVGSLAAKGAVEGARVSGVLVKRGFTYNVMAPEDLPEYTGLTTRTVKQTQTIAYHAPLSLLQHYLEQMYGSVDVSSRDGRAVLRVFEAVTVVHTDDTSVTLEWESDVTSDMIADSVMAVVLQVESNPMSVKLVGSRCAHKAKEAHHHKDGSTHFDFLKQVFEAQFGTVTAQGQEKLVVTVDNNTAVINVADNCVESATDRAIELRAKGALSRAEAVSFPARPPVFSEVI